MRANGWAAAILAMALAGLPTDRARPEEAAAIAAGESREFRDLGAARRASFALAADAGDYVRGEMAVAAGRFDLDLEAADGRHLRRLATDAEGRAAFQFVVPQAPVRLTLTALSPGSGTLAVTTRMPPGQQNVPQVASRVATAPPLSPVLTGLAAGLGPAPSGAALDDAWTQVARRGTPLVEPRPDGTVLITFLARGARRNVRLLGAPTGDHEWLERLGGTDIWFRSFVVPAQTRMSYRLAPDVPDIPGTARERRMALLATAAADPLNRAPWPSEAPDAFSQDSTVELPGAPEQPGLAPKGAPRGALTAHRISSPRLGNTRTVTIYTPAGFNPKDPRNILLILFDAQAYLTKVPTPAILDTLIAEGRLPPVIAVFVSEIDPPTRARELPGNPAFADVMAEEVLPLVRRTTGAEVGAGRTILAGSSFGGLAAATIALRHPAQFGNAIALSGSFWFPQDHPDAHVASRVADMPRAAVRFHLAAGLFETAHAGTEGILDTSRRLRDVLQRKGYDVSYREYAGGHDYLVWRGALADALLALAARLDASAGNGPPR